MLNMVETVVLNMVETVVLKMIQTTSVFVWSPTHLAQEIVGCRA